MVTTGLSGQLPQLSGSGDSKGVGYTIEAFLAVLTLAIFTFGSLQSPPTQNWNRFQGKIAAKDVGYVLQSTGNMEGFLERGETGSMRTVASTLIQNRMKVSGTVANLPIGKKRTAFHVLIDRIHDFNPQSASSLGDECESRGDLEEIESQYDILRTQNERHGVYLYLADSDPEVPGGFNSEKDYDSLWVDNKTRCQFSASEGPYYQEQFFMWGNKSDGIPDLHYDFKNISDNGDKLLVYEAEQPVRFKKMLKKDVNGIETRNSVDTFNFSTGNLESYDTLVFRRRGSLNLVNNDADKEKRLMDYLKDDSALFLMNLQKSDLSTGFMARTGLKWKGLGWSEKPSGTSFTDGETSGRVENLFLGQSGNPGSVTMLPGGNITGKIPLVFAEKGEYITDDWNATNMSMDVDNNPPPGVAESECGNYREGRFEFPDDDYKVWSSELGDCTDASEVWGLSIDLDKNGQIEKDEKTFVNGDTLYVDDRIYATKIYPASGDCSTGECAEFIYVGEERIEIINAATSFKDSPIGRFGRADYQDTYSLEERKLLTAVLYWLNGKQNSFGKSSGGISTTSVGGIKNQVYIPYSVSMRWER